MKNILLTVACLFTANVLFAQHAHFTTSGTIAYEKSVNVYAILNKELGPNVSGLTQTALEQFKKNQPQFKVLKSTLTFSNDKSLFMPLPDESTPGNFFGDIPMAVQRNIVYTDLAAKSSVIQKNFFDDNFLIKDSTRKINWKITDETREIAGYTCRRANALVLDSVYIVAFYTNDIHVSGGPESFTGLPGMILELAVPHENIIWRATKITDAAVPATAIVPPKKGKVVNNKQLKANIDDFLKNRGSSKGLDLMVRDVLL